MINPEVKRILLSKGIIEDEAMLYLLALHFRLNVCCIPGTIIKRVNLTGIVTRQFGNGDFKVRWNTPLFLGKSNPTDSNWEWVNTDFRVMFKKVNPDRNGVLQSCIARMKKFFAQYPQFRKADVLAATKAYLYTVSEAQYCKSAHKFIFEGTGTNQHSMLLEWCERTKEHENKTSTFKKMGE